MTPLVIAHRGASAEFAEHTMAAYERAIELGADGLECDVRLTADDELVCIHDATIDRTSNGRGSVSTKTLAQLRRWDTSAWKSGADPQPVGEVNPRDQILTLNALLGLVADASRSVSLSIETKHPTRDGARLEAALVKALRRVGRVPKGDNPADPQGQLRVMSFSAAALGRMRAIAPSIPTVYLVDAPRDVEGRLPHGALVSGPGIRGLRADPGHIDRMHKRGQRVHVWTVDSHDDVDWCLARGVDALITNRTGEVVPRVRHRRR